MRVSRYASRAMGVHRARATACPLRPLRDVVLRRRRPPWSACAVKLRSSAFGPCAARVQREREPLFTQCHAIERVRCW